MRIIKTKSYEEMSKKAANIIASVVTLKPDCMLGLAQDHHQSEHMMN